MNQNFLRHRDMLSKSVTYVIDFKARWVRISTLRALINLSRIYQIFKKRAFPHKREYLD